jgi:hypothetical protein
LKGSGWGGRSSDPTGFGTSNDEVGDENWANGVVVEEGDRIDQDRRAKNAEAICPKRSALPKPGFVAIATF